MELQVLWFVIWGVLWAVYFMTDGFDLGVGMLLPFLGGSEEEKRRMLLSIGPVWDGNEVWLITAGGATFAAFPVAYADLFSYLYIPLLFILFALILRGVALEFRNKEDSRLWHRCWDGALFIGSLTASLLFGVAFGNLFQGLLMDRGGYGGTLSDLLNPYGLLTGVFFVLLFVTHGALWVALKTDGDLRRRGAAFVVRSWPILLMVALLFLFNTAFATNLYENFLGHLFWFAVPAAAAAALLGIRRFAAKGRYLAAFLASTLSVGLVVLTGIIGLYPYLIPSRPDPAFGLTIFQASSSPYTLKIMTVVALIFVPAVIAYQVWVYLVFRREVTEEDGY